MTETFTPVHQLSKFQQGDHPTAAKLNANWTKIDTALMGQATAFPATYPATKLLLRTDEGIIYKNTGSFETPTWTIILAADEADLTGLEGETGDEVIISMHVEGDAQEEFTISADGTLSWGSGSAPTDISLERIGGGVLGQRGSIPQAFRVYGNATDRIEISHTGTSGAISTNTGSIFFGVQGSFKWRIEAPTGHLIANGDNQVDIGASGANRPRSIYWGTQLIGPLGSAGAPAITLGGLTTGFYSRNPTITAVVSGSTSAEFQSGFFCVVNATAPTILFTDAAGGNTFTSLVAGADLLELKRTTNGQTFRVYCTTTGPRYLQLEGTSSDYASFVVPTAAMYLQLRFASSETINFDSTGIFPNVDNQQVLGHYVGPLRWLAIYMGTGSDAAPSVSIGDEETGFYKTGESIICRALNSFEYCPVSPYTTTAGFSYDYAGMSGGAIFLGDGTDDVRFGRIAANVLGLVNGTNAQEFRVYGTTTGPKYLSVIHDGSSAYLVTNEATSALGLGINGIVRWSVKAADGSWIPSADNTYSVGDTTNKALAVHAYSYYIGETDARLYRAAADDIRMMVDGTDYSRWTAGAFIMNQNSPICWGSSGIGAADTFLSREGAGVLALSSGPSPCTFRVYGTTTGPKFLRLLHDGTDSIIDSQSGNLFFYTGGSFRWGISASALGPLSTDDTYDLGGSGNRIRSGFFGTSISVGTTPAATGWIRIPNDTAGNGLVARNNANNGDMILAGTCTQNSVVDVQTMGRFTAGVLMKARSGAGAPGTSDIPSGEWCLWRDTSGGTTKVYYNNAGAIQSVGLA